jgi:peptide-N4-(N-acetyl-beta-glucosaminyl)asparagine amidase
MHNSDTALARHLQVSPAAMHCTWRAALAAFPAPNPNRRCHLQAEEDAAAVAVQRAAAQHNLRGGGAVQTRFAQQVEGAIRKVLAYEDELGQAMALSMMPLDQLTAAAREACAVSAAMGEQPPLAEEDGECTPARAGSWVPCSSAGKPLPSGLASLFRSASHTLTLCPPLIPAAAAAAAAALALELLVWFKRDFFSWVDNAPCEKCGCKSTKADAMVGPNPQEAEHGAAHVELYRCPKVHTGGLAALQMCSHCTAGHALLLPAGQPACLPAATPA